MVTAEACSKFITFLVGHRGPLEAKRFDSRTTKTPCLETKTLKESLFSPTDRPLLDFELFGNRRFLGRLL